MIKKNNGSILAVVFFTEKCNLNCRYCYVKQSPRTMSWDTARQSVDFISSLEYKDKTLCFMGGEPLVEWGLVKRMTRYAQSKGIDKFNLCTNTVLIDQKKLDYFKDNNFNIMLSIDGISEAHDMERRNHRNGCSFFEVEKAINLISSNRNRLRFTIQMCLSPFNINCLSKSFKYFLKKRIANTKIYLIPIVNPDYIWNKEDFKIFKQQTKELFVIYKRNKNLLKNCKLVFGKCCSPLGLTELKKTKDSKRELCLCKDRYYGIDIKGDIYYCFFSGFSKYKDLTEEYKLGNIWEGIIREEKLKDFTGYRMSRYMSCLAWNYVVNRNVKKAVDIYKKLYSIWIENE